jgi:hypothetical protein
VVRLDLTRAQILAHRRTVGALDERLPAGADGLRRAAWAGLQDSMPRAALLSIHARVEGRQPTTWEDPSLVQVWGPRFSAYVVATADRAVFTLGRLPDEPARRRRAEATAHELEALLDGRRMPYGDAGRDVVGNPNRFRYAAPTGRVVMRWDGAHRPTIWMVPAPAVDPHEARLELARRYLHVFGPATPEAFAIWAGIKPDRGRAAFVDLQASLTPVGTPTGGASILTADEPTFRAVRGPRAPARLLPSGDTFFLLWGADRNVLVPETAHRPLLWTPRVWPGAVLVDGEIVGTWRRAGTEVAVDAWRPLSANERAAVEAEAASFPLPDAKGPIGVRW